MDTNDKPVLIYATFPDMESAEAAGRHLVERAFCACVNILPGMVSIYRWEGAIEQSEECVLIIKTRASQAEAAIAEGRMRHPYTNPAFLVIPVTSGSPPYIDWLMANANGPA